MVQERWERTVWVPFPVEPVGLWWCPSGDPVVFVQARVEIEQKNSDLMNSQGDQLDQPRVEGPRSRTRGLVCKEDLWEKSGIEICELAPDQTT